MREALNLIDGQLTPASDDGWIDVVDPASGSVFGRCADSTTDDVARAVAAARRAFPEWRDTPVAERALCLERLATLLAAEVDELALLESTDQGKTLAQAREIEIPRAIANLRYFAGAVRHTAERFHDGDGRALHYTLRRPRGVAACISPWNLPLYLFTWKIAPALATGNTVVGKPSEITPMTASRLAELSERAGFPRGVFNLLHGRGGVVGQSLVEHPDVPTITFTGGTETGKRIAATAAPMFKRLSLELGGKNPTIICEDADLERHLPTIVRSAFTNQGEICLCGSRILVHRSLFETFTRRFIEATRGLKVGDPLDSESDLGALVSREHLDKVRGAIERAHGDGGRLACGGGPPAHLNARCRDGFFLEPTVILGLGAGCATLREEIFGPVVSIQAFETHGEAVRHANDVPYGLAATIFTRDVTRAHRMAARLDCGIVWVNGWMVRDLRTPFGGWKASGVGREGGEEALKFFTEATSVTVALQ